MDKVKMTEKEYKYMKKLMNTPGRLEIVQGPGVTQDMQPETFEEEQNDALAEQEARVKFYRDNEARAQKMDKEASQAMEEPRVVDVGETIAQRGNEFGTYKGGMLFRTKILSLITDRYFEVHGEYMPLGQMSLFMDIVMKLGRLAANPTHTDSWHDLAGYAVLIDKVLQGETI